MELTFEWYEDAMLFHIFIFIFLFRTISVTVIIISKVLFLKLLNISKNISDISYVQSTFLIFTKHIGNGIWKTPCTWRFYGNGLICANFSMGKYHETKMGHGAQKAISSSKPWACFMKNISLIVFFFSQANLAFKLNLTLMLPQFIYLFICCAPWNSASASMLFYMN